jgi:hypothetical protein
MMQYSLDKNLLTPDPNDCIAVPANVRVYTFDEILQRITLRYTGLTPTQLLAASKELFEEICMIVENGDGVNTPIVNIYPGMTGVYNGATDSFDPKRHRCRANLTAGKQLNAAVKKIKTEKIVVPESLPYILEVKDIVSDSVDDSLTPGGVIQLRGSKLKLVPAIPEDGIYLTEENGAVTKLAVLVENKPARLMAMIPADLPQGIYTLTVKTSAASTKPLKAPKTGIFNRALTVL